MSFLLLRLGDDFISECDLLMACRILEKQIELGVDEGKNIIIPSKHMNKPRKIAQTGIRETFFIYS
jgi:hypothetical protein